jgi:hypothetical protein
VVPPLSAVFQGGKDLFGDGRLPQEARTMGLSSNRSIATKAFPEVSPEAGNARCFGSVPQSRNMTNSGWPTTCMCGSRRIVLITRKLSY